MGTLPSGTVTFLFTDIEGSTQLWENFPEEMKSALAKHDALLRKIFQAHQGFVFKTVGDSFCVAFDSPISALNAVIDSQRALQNESWGDTNIKVRMALHCGEVENRDNDYFGLPLNRVARLLSAGHGGQVLISTDVQKRIQEHLPKDITLSDMGEHKLKGIPQPFHIFQVLAPGLQQKFPPLRTLSVLPNNLPAQITSFIGREQDMADIKLAINDHRLVTLTGAGGTGKTRLALQVATDLIDQYQGGVWLVELAPITNPDLILQTILLAVGISEQQGMSPLQLLLDYLRGKKILILLDNCEHLIGASAKLTKNLLHHAPELKILTTSREALGVQGELIWQVPSLSLPEIDQSPTIKQLLQYEAVQLFLERVMLAQPQFVLSNDNAPVLTQICIRLDGIPLAIELAAARVRTLNLNQIAERLDDRFRLLAGGSRTALERHQTLQATVDWSYNLLPEEEQVLFRRLAIFVGGWTLEGVESVCANETGVNVLGRLEQLINKSLVITERENEVSRYHMLETIRQYANDKLVNSGEGRWLKRKHLEFFVYFAGIAESYINGPEQVTWLDRLEGDHDNIRGALAWALEESEFELAARLVTSLFWFWLFRTHIREARQWLEQIVELGRHNAQTESVPKSTVALFAHTLNHAGFFANVQGDYDLGYSKSEEGLALSRKIRDKKLISQALIALGIASTAKDDYARAKDHLEESLTVTRKLEDKCEIARSLLLLGNLALSRKFFVKARTYYNEGLTIAHEMGDKTFIAIFTGSLGFVDLKELKYTSALDRFKEELLIYREVGNKRLIVDDLVVLASLTNALGNYEDATRLCGAVKNLSEDFGFAVGKEEKVEYDHTLLDVRTRLDKTRFEQLWQEGRSMSLEQAIEYALELAND